MVEQASNSLLLAGSASARGSLFNSDNFPQHHNTVAVHEGHAGKTLAVLEGVADKWLLGLEIALGHLVGLEGVRIIHLLAASLLAHLPLQLVDTAGGTATSHE